MPNELYCNVIGVTDGEVRDNILFIGNAVSNPIGGAVEDKAIELYKHYCDTLGSVSENPDEIDDMVEDGCLSTKDHRVKVFINWPALTSS